MPSFITNTQPNRLKVSVDTFSLNTSSAIGIDSVRQLIQFLTRAPLIETRKTVTIFPADLLTFEAQNALLKTLEEPPEYADIYLITLNPDALLPTLRSRCLDVSLHAPIANRTPSALLASLDTIAPLTASKRLQAAQKTKYDRPALLAEIKQSLLELSFSLKSEPKLTCLNRLKTLNETYKGLKDNANLSLALDHLYLTWPS